MSDINERKWKNITIDDITHRLYNYGKLAADLSHGLGDELINKLDTEIADRKAGDNDLQSQLNTEIGTRKSGDADLQSQLDTEKTSRENADGELGTRIDQLETNLLEKISAVYYYLLNLINSDEEDITDE